MDQSSEKTEALELVEQQCAPALKISENNIDIETEKDDSEIIIQRIQDTKLEILRELYESIGINLGDTYANVSVHNYSIENPLQIKSTNSNNEMGGDPTLGNFGGGTLKITGDTANIQLLVKRGEIKQYGDRLGCFGKLYVNGEYFCDCAERATNTTKRMHPTNVRWKIATTPAQGNHKSGNLSWYRAKDKWHDFVRISNGYVPQIMVNTGAQGIRIHEGSGPGWSEGCLIVGEYNNGRFSCDSSYNAWVSLYSYLVKCESASIMYT